MDTFIHKKKKKNPKISFTFLKLEMVSVYAEWRKKTREVWTCSLQTGKTYTVIVLVACEDSSFRKDVAFLI